LAAKLVDDPVLPNSLLPVAPRRPGGAIARRGPPKHWDHLLKKSVLHEPVLTSHGVVGVDESADVAVRTDQQVVGSDSQRAAAAR
jgi:hypothetical protein